MRRVARHGTETGILIGSRNRSEWAMRRLEEPRCSVMSEGLENRRIWGENVFLAVTEGHEHTGWLTRKGKDPNPSVKDTRRSGRTLMPPDLRWASCAATAFIPLPNDIRKTILGALEQFVKVTPPRLPRTLNCLLEGRRDRNDTHWGRCGGTRTECSWWRCSTASP